MNHLPPSSNPLYNQLLSELRSIPSSLCLSPKERRPTLPIHVLLERALPKFLPTPNATLSLLNSHWLDIVGPIHFPYCHPSSLKGPTLFIATSNPTSKYDLSCQKKSILKKINSILQNSSITSLAFSSK